MVSEKDIPVGVKYTPLAPAAGSIKERVDNVTLPSSTSTPTRPALARCYSPGGASGVGSILGVPDFNLRLEYQQKSQSQSPYSTSALGPLELAAVVKKCLAKFDNVTEDATAGSDLKGITMPTVAKVIVNNN